jgi:hypothetical protein
VLLFCTNGNSNGESDKLKKFNETCQERWHEYLMAHDGMEIECSIVAHFNGVLTEETHSVEGLCFPNFFSHTKSEFTERFAELHRRSWPDFPSHLIAENVRLFNPKYSVRLLNTENGWTVHDFLSRPNLTKNDFIFIPLIERYNRELVTEIQSFISFFAPGIALDASCQVPILFKHPKFKIESSEETIEDGVKCLKISFTLDISEEERVLFTTIESGTFTFVTDYWVLKHAEYIDGGIMEQLDFQYDYDSCKIPLLKQKDKIMSGIKNKFVDKSIWKYNIRPLKDKNDPRFYLSGYDIPEPG